MKITFKEQARQGIWDNNIIFTQRLALCPLLAVTGTATNGLGMGLATTGVLMASGIAVSALRNIVPQDVRIPSFILIIATIVTLVDMAMNAWMHELYKVLGLFISLIVTNCSLLGRAEAFSSKNTVWHSMIDGLMIGIGFTMVLVILGAVREIIGSGTLFANASLLLGNFFSFLTITIIPEYKGFLLFILPPGGFIALGFLIAGKYYLEEYLQNRKVARETAPMMIDRMAPSGAD